MRSLEVFSYTALVEASRREDPAADDLLARLDAACTDPGGFLLVDCPVPDGLLEQMLGSTQRFFELPVAEKSRYRWPEDQYVGWRGSDNQNQHGFADYKEMFHIGPRVAPTLATSAPDGSVPAPASDLADEALATCSLWPAELPEFVEVWHRYFAAMQELAAGLGSACAAALGIEPSEWLETLADNYSDLAANFYPPVAPDAGAKPVYNAPHADLTVFTILIQNASRIGGLSMEAVDGTWIDAVPTPGVFVVNVGELLTYLSGDRWRAVPHQVKVAETGETARDPRISIPFFHRPHDAKDVVPFVGEAADPISVGEWVRQRKAYKAPASTAPATT
jgi:isopenicillin N synthase-like dioxygenase